MLLGVGRNALLFSGLFTFLDHRFSKENYGSLVAACTGRFSPPRRPRCPHKHSFSFQHKGVAAIVGAGVVPLIEFSHKQYNHTLFALLLGLVLCYVQPMLLLYLRERAPKKERRSIASKSDPA
jgi:hypothetical protein